MAKAKCQIKVKHGHAVNSSGDPGGIPNERTEIEYFPLPMSAAATRDMAACCRLGTRKQASEKKSASKLAHSTCLLCLFAGSPVRLAIALLFCCISVMSKPNSHDVK